MQLAQAAKEKMHAPVFSLAASAAFAATTKSEGTNPIPQPDALTHFFERNRPPIEPEAYLSADSSQMRFLRTRRPEARSRRPFWLPLPRSWGSGGAWHVLGC